MRLIDAEAFEKQVIAMGIKNGYLPEKINAMCELINKQQTVCEKETQCARRKKCGFCAQIESLNEECDVMIYRPSNHGIYGHLNGSNTVTPFCLNYCPECGKKMVSGEAEIND